MYSYTINLSDGLIDIEHSFCFCGPMGIPKHTMAENVIDALTNVFNSAVVECTYDISGEWIEIVENETGSVYRHMITKIQDFDRFLGEFEYNGIEISASWMTFQRHQVSMWRGPNIVMIPISGGRWRISSPISCRCTTYAGRSRSHPPCRCISDHTGSCCLKKII